MESISIVLTLKNGSRVIIHRGDDYSGEIYNPLDLKRLISEDYITTSYHGPRFQGQIWSASVKFREGGSEGLLVGVPSIYELPDVLEQPPIRRAFRDATLVVLRSQDPKSAYRICQILRLCDHCSEIHIHFTYLFSDSAEYIPPPISLPALRVLKIEYSKEIQNLTSIRTHFYDSFVNLRLTKVILCRTPLTTKMLREICQPSLKSITLVGFPGEGLPLLGPHLRDGNVSLKRLSVKFIIIPLGMRLPLLSDEFELHLLRLLPTNIKALLRSYPGNPGMIRLVSPILLDARPRIFLELLVRVCRQVNTLQIFRCNWLNYEAYMELLSLWAVYGKQKLRAFVFDAAGPISVAYLKSLPNPGGTLADHVFAGDINSDDEICNMYEVRGTGVEDDPPPPYSSTASWDEEVPK